MTLGYPSLDYAIRNEGKADFDDIYNRRDPRLYYRTLNRHDYAIPQLGNGIFREVIRTFRAERRTDTVTVLDLGCSYGVNAGLLKFDLDLDDLYARYSGAEHAALSASEMLCADQEFFANQAADRGLGVVGLDAAPNAVNYAVEVGLLDHGISENLEEAPPSSRAAQRIADADIVISTGCVGYVTERTFERLLAVRNGGSPPWIASFVLRMFPYDSIRRCLAIWGLATEKLVRRTFVQRRFASSEEQGHVLHRLADLGIDPTGKEDTGFLHAEFFLSRPVEDVAETPLPDILPESSKPA